MPENLTITISVGDDDTGARQFLALFQDTLEILDAIKREMPADERGDSDQEWPIVAMNKESPPRVTIAGAAAVFSMFINGMNAIEHKTVAPFSTHVMRKVEALGNRLDASPGASVEFSSPDLGKGTATALIKEHAKSAVGERYYEMDGSVDGMLDLIGVVAKLRLVVIDDIDERRIACRFAPELLDKAKDMLGRRVTVIGVVRYRTADDVPVSIEAVDIEQIDDGDGVGFADLPSIDLAPGESSEDYIRRMRDG